MIDLTHHSRGQSRDVKKMPMKSEGASKISASRASKRAPTWHSCMTTPKSLSGQPNPDLIQRLARKGFLGSHTAMSCGGSFRSSWRADFHGALRFHWHFFYVPRLSSGTMWLAFQVQSGILLFWDPKHQNTVCWRPLKSHRNFTFANNSKVVNGCE